MVTQTAGVRWSGTIARGEGVLHSASEVLDGLGVDLPNRMHPARGKTSPEELLAAAHATCFAMALGSILAGARTPPERLEVVASVHLDTTEGDRHITSIDLVVSGSVPDADSQALSDALPLAEQRCLISRALDDAIEIRSRIVPMRQV